MRVAVPAAPRTRSWRMLCRSTRVVAPRAVAAAARPQTEGLNDELSKRKVGSGYSGPMAATATPPGNLKDDIKKHELRGGYGSSRVAEARGVR